MVAVVLLGLWLVVIAPVAVALLVGRRQDSTLTAFEAAIRGLDRSSASAVAVVGPNLRPPRRLPSTVVKTRTRRTRKRQHVVFAIGLTVVALSLVGVALDFGRTSLAIHALADQCLVAYATAVVAIRTHSASRPGARA